MRWRVESPEPLTTTTTESSSSSSIHTTDRRQSSSGVGDEDDEADSSSTDANLTIPETTKHAKHRRLEATPHPEEEADSGDEPDNFNQQSQRITKILKQHMKVKEESDPPDRKKKHVRYEDGGDHAEEPVRVPWKPQTSQSTCEFTHTISNYAQQRESGCKKAEYSSTTVDEYGNRWRLIIYVNGNGRASNHHLSLFLQVADAEDLPFGWKKSVSYVLTLEHPKGGSFSYAKRNPDKMFKLCPKAIDWGWSQFITSDRIQQEAFVLNDTLTVRASVTVKTSSVNIDEEDAELYLKCAVEEGDTKSVQICLDHGASVNCKFKDDLYTPLHTACSSGSSKGSIKVMNLLLKQGAFPNAWNKWRETPLLIAANNGHYAACEALLGHGADPSLCSEAGWSALTFAAHKGYDDIVKLLLEKDAPVNTRVAEDSSTPLHKACAGSKPGHTRAVELLVQKNADVHALNKWRETPLLTAANHGQAASVKALLGANADPCKCTDTGWSPLSIAAYKGHDEVVRLLLEEGAPTEEEDPTLSALLQAATKGLPGTVELLLKNGADHTVTTKKGDTALSILVEQNHIDAAVDMVTIYNASIPRCSRDRKKVQRARLLISLRMKQLERDSKNQSASTDEDDCDEEGSDISHDSLYEEEEETEASTSKTKKKRDDLDDSASGESAEAKARAAEEALLLELELEDAKAKKEEAEANSKRAKKKKKKDQVRQQKLKEEDDRRLREELEAQEREKITKEKEEKKRKELEAKENEKREQEIKEMIEQERAMTAKRKERQRREKTQLKQREKEIFVSSPTNSESSEKKVNNAMIVNPSPKSTSVNDSKIRCDLDSVHSPKKPSSPASRRAPPLVGNRRWETKPKSPSKSSAFNSSRMNQPPSLPIAMASKDYSETSPSSFLAPRPRGSSANGVINTNSFVTSEVAVNANGVLPLKRVVAAQLNLEHPAVSLFRRQKVFELLQSLSTSAVVNIMTIRIAVYRWIVRAAHDNEPYLDPLIPSWKDTNRLIAFFQRQFISHLRCVQPGSTDELSIEGLRETGASVALSFHSLGIEVKQFQCRIDGNIHPDWSDTSIEMNRCDGIGVDGSPVSSLSWANHYTVQMKSSTFAALHSRYSGSSNRLLATLFVTKIWYETREIITTGSCLEVQLPRETQVRLSSDAGVSLEIWIDPFSVLDRNAFWGCFEELDMHFGGHAPFVKHDLRSDNILVRQGGSVSLLAPLDSTMSSLYMKRIIDCLSAAEQQGTPLSFAIFLQRDCFPDLSSGPTLHDLCHLDQRLAEPQKLFIQNAEVLPAGQHSFRSGCFSEAQNVSRYPSLFVLLQNNAGKSRFHVTNAAVRNILETLLVSSRPDTPVVTPLVFSADFIVHEGSRSPQPVYLDGLPHVSPEPLRVVHSDFGTIGGTRIGKPFTPSGYDSQRPPYHGRGRLFDLVDDGEDDPLGDMNQGIDLVSGMLNNLDVGLFHGGNLAPDIDIEAISLMGIGGPSTQSSLTGNSPPSRFD